MVAAAPRDRPRCCRGFLDFAGDAVLVAHNAGFDVGHLDAAHEALAGRPLGQPGALHDPPGAPPAARAAASLARRGRRRRSVSRCFDRHRGAAPTRASRPTSCASSWSGPRERGDRRDSTSCSTSSAAPRDGEPFVVHVSRERVSTTRRWRPASIICSARTAGCSTSARPGGCASGCRATSRTRAGTRRRRSS